MTCSIAVAPRPPYALGHETPSQPASPSLRSQARRTSMTSSSGRPRSRLARYLSGRFVLSQEANSRRNVSSAGVRLRSKTSAVAESLPALSEWIVVAALPLVKRRAACLPYDPSSSMGNHAPPRHASREGGPPMASQVRDAAIVGIYEYPLRKVEGLSALQIKA